MKTNETTATRRIILKDGKTTIATWPDNRGIPPTVGDRIEIPQDIASEHAGYGTHAVVSRVEVDSAAGGLVIDAEVESRIPDGKRPVVTLNASLIPTSHREAIIGVVRARFDLPVIEWEESFESSPVIRLHTFDDRGNSGLPELNAELRSVLNGLLETAGI